jgi:ribonuclease P protein component
MRDYFAFRKYLCNSVLSVAKQYTLGKKERLKSRKQIEQLFSEGKRFTITPFLVYYLVNGECLPAGKAGSMVNNKSNLQFGTGVSGKIFKKAVDRNRIKRLIREAWRLQHVELKEKLKAAGNQLNVFLIYTGKEMPEYKLVSEKVKSALQKLEKLIG